MVASLLWSEKIRRPAPSGLRRARLEDALVGHGAPALTLVSAPAGSGKSTLLARVAAAADLPVTWYRVTADDADPAVFVRQLGVALGLEPLAAATGDVHRVVAAAHLSEQARLLLVDDLHEIAGTASETIFETFVALRPQSIRIILASRRAPELNLPLMRAAGAIHEINNDDLRFRVWEVEELFTLVHREPLSPETAAALTRRTGGWAAGLQLFHLANARKTASARRLAVSSLGPRARLIRSYLTRNVLDELPPERRRFLVLTSALGMLSASLCDELLDTTDSGELLEELERDQVFTTSVDDGLTYRYHEVLQRHLQMSLLTELGVPAAREWYARCAALLEQAGAHADALRAYAMAEDWAATARLVQDESGDSTTAIAGEPDRLLPPGLIRTDPWLALADARRRLRHGDLAAAIEGFDHARTLLDEPRFQEMCTAEAVAARIWLPGPAAAAEPDVSGSWSARIRSMTRLDAPARRAAARRVSPTAGKELGPEALAAGLEALLAGRFDAASAHFAEVTATMSGIGLVQLAGLLGAVVADAADPRSVDTGGLAARLEEITLDADAGGYPWVSRLARGLLAAILAVSDAAPWRLDTFSELLTECERAGDAWGAALLQLACALAGDLVGHVAAPDRFADAGRRLHDLDAGALSAWARRLSDRGDGAAPEFRVRVGCFGGFEVFVDGRPADLGALRPRALALLRLLALEHDTNVHRERLIDMLWPGAALDVGIRRLQVAVSSVRTALQHAGVADLDAVRRIGDSYRLVLTDADVDVARFEELLAQARRETRNAGRRIELRTRALDLYAGELFPEEGTIDYVVAERERLRLAAADAACALARDHAAGGDLAAASTAARASIRLDRYQDAAWELLADCLAADGDDTSAQRARMEHSQMRAALDTTDRPARIHRSRPGHFVPPLSGR